MSTYKQTIEYLDSLVNYEKSGLTRADKEFDLEKLRDILKDIGSPQKDYRSAHVAGTKGKGSVSAYIASIMQSLGLKVGLFTSPHLVDPTERIRINGKAISAAELSEVLDRLRERIDPGEKKLTYFEIYTLMAMMYFSMKKVDLAVFEVGLGGRLDATNVIEPEVCAISPISYDHTGVLGETLPEIAAEKAAIIKKGTFCVSAPQRPSVMKVLRQRCLDEDAELVVVTEDIKVDVKKLDAFGGIFDIKGIRDEYEGCHTVMPGDFQPVNCAVAVGVCERLLKEKGKRKKEKIKEGIENAFLPGRMEVLGRDPLIVIDAAQNVDSAEHLKYSVEQIFKYDRLILLLGMSRDKDIRGVCETLSPMADEIVLTKASVGRAADPGIIRGYIKEKKTHQTSDVKEALGLALNSAGKKDLIVATGSFFVIGEVRKLILGKT